MMGRRTTSQTPVQGQRAASIHVRVRARALALTLTAATVAVALTTGCNATATIGEGAVTSETREVRAFKRIDAGAGISVSIGIGPTPTVEVRAQANIVPIVETDVANSTLRIHSAHGYTSEFPVESS